MHVLAFSASLILLTSVLFGLAPAIRATRSTAQGSLREAGRGGTASRERATFTRALVAVQIALSLLLAMGAGLFLRSLWNLQSVTLGYPRDNLLLVQVDRWNAGYRGERAATLSQDLAARIRELAGVRSVSYSDRGLFSGSEGAAPVEVDGFTSRKEEDRGSTFDSVGPGYFSTIGIPIVLGREVDLRDMRRPPRVCVINEAFAKRFFAGRNPIGRYFTTIGSEEDGKDASRRMEVIGVAKDARVASLRGAIDPKFYVAGDGSWFEIRTSGDPNHLRNAVRSAILSVNANLPIQAERTLGQTLAAENAQPRLIAQLATTFGVLALFLAAIGIYGLLSYGVVRRTNEIGIRMALGATRASVIGMILKETGYLILGGSIAGVAAAAAAAHFFALQLSGLDGAVPRWSLERYEQVDSAVQLYGLRAMDSFTIGVAVAAVCVIGLMAAYLPALRAARVDPVQALRNE